MIENNSSAENTESAKQTPEEDVQSAIDFFKRRGIPWCDIAKRQLLTLPPAVQSFNTLQYLNINTNKICSLPETFFESFPLLSWFDARFNLLTFLPSTGLASHTRLQTLLLQGNKLTTLPLELGLVKSLQDVQFANNPLEFPAQDVLSQGTAVIKDFLSAVLHTNGRIPAVLPEDTSSFGNYATSKTSDGASVGSQSRRKFSSSLSTFDDKRKPNGRQVNATTSIPQAAVVGSTELPSADVLLIKAKEANAREARKKKLSKIDKILQKRKDFQALDDFRDETKEMQRRRELEKRFNGGRLDYDEPAKLAPFGVSESEMQMKNDYERRRPASPPQKPRPLSPETIDRIDKLQAEKDVELTVMIKEHMTRVASKTRLRGRDVDPGTAQEDLQNAKRELEIAQRLQQEVSRRRKEMEFRMNMIQKSLAAKVSEPKP